MPSPKPKNFQERFAEEIKTAFRGGLITEEEMDQCLNSFGVIIDNKIFCRYTDGEVLYKGRAEQKMVDRMLGNGNN